MQQTDIMIDIETLGGPPDAVPVTIGVAAFDLTSNTVIEKFQIHVHVGTAQKAGLTLDAGTVMWWVAQSKEAQASLISKSAVSLNQALTGLTEYVSKRRSRNFNNRLNVWGNDPDFDMVILTAAYKALGQEPPWRYYETRSTRTMLELAERLFKFNKKRDFPRHGTHHAADDDAEFQATMVQHIYQRLANPLQSTPSPEVSAT